MFLLFFFLLRGGQELCPVPNYQLRFLLCLFMESQFQNLLKPMKSISTLSTLSSITVITVKLNNRDQAPLLFVPSCC